MAKARIKITEEELQRDEVAESLQEGLDWVRENRVKLIAVAVLVVGALGGGLFWRGYRAQIEQDTSAILNGAFTIFDRIPSMQDAAERDRQLKDLVTDLQTRVVDRYADSPMALRAIYLQGNCLYYMDDLKGAQDAFSRFLDRAEEPTDVARGRMALGNAIENEFYFTNDQKRLQEAYDQYQQAGSAAPPGSYLRIEAKMAGARIQELTSNDADALEIYREVLAERPLPNAAPDRKPESQGNALFEMAREQIDRQLESVSFHATARLRSERIDGALALVGASKSLPASPGAEIEGPMMDSATTGSATSIPMEVAPESGLSLAPPAEPVAAEAAPVAESAPASDAPPAE